MTDSSVSSGIADQLGKLPHEADAALILRHAEREEIPPGTFGVDVSLTSCGVASAERLGATLSSLRPKISVTASPVPRCNSTAAAIMRGGKWAEKVALDWRLGDPGPFVVDEEVSGALFMKSRHFGYSEAPTHLYRASRRHESYF